MIIKAWGDWTLFQLLLTTLREIGDRHGGVSIANVSVKWVLEHDFVGAVIIGRPFLPKFQIIDFAPISIAKVPD